MFKLTGVDIPTIRILRGASFGEERIQRMFQGSEWIFYDDGKFTFQGKSSQWDNSISGTYVKVDNNFEVQGEYNCDDNRTISMDGTIYDNGEQSVLEAIYTNLVFSQQIATISQKLIKEEIQESELTLEPEKIVDTEIDEDLKKFLEEGENFLQEMEELYGPISDQNFEDIEIPSQFKISLKGKTDRGDFESLPGTLFINRTSQDSQHPLSISLGINSELFGSNGWISLRFPEAGGGNANRQMTVEKNQVCIQFNSDSLTNAPTYTLGTDVSDSYLNNKVFIENFIFNFTVEGDHISGEIKASGRHLRDLEKTGTYEAKLTGQIPKSLPVEELKTALASKFNGKWDTDNSSLGDIELQQHGQQVRGTYTGQNDGIIEGIIQGNRLDFQWQDYQKEQKGQGFLRAVAGGGKLVGSICLRENPNSLVKEQIVIGFWQLPPVINLETFTPFDLEELRYLSQDFALKYKYDQAVVLLNKLISYYLPPQEEQIKVYLQDFDGRDAVELIRK